MRDRDRIVDPTFWQRSRSDRRSLFFGIVQCTANTLWNEGEPNNSNSENCVLVHKEDVGDDGEIYGLNNIDCSTKSNIICMKNKK